MLRIVIFAVATSSVLVGALKVDPTPAPRALAGAAAGHETQACPDSITPSKSKSLSEYKFFSRECQRGCRAMGPQCYFKCLKDCTRALGPPSCDEWDKTSSCGVACEKLMGVWDCNRNLIADGLCENKIDLTKVPAGGCQYSK